MRILLFALLMVALALSGGASARAFLLLGGQAAGGVPSLSANNAFTGPNTSSGLGSATHSSSECGSTITPVHNNVVCTLTANTVLGTPTFKDGTPIELTVTQNGTGGYTLSLPNPGYAANCGTYCSGANLLISTGANTTSTIDLFSAPLPSGNVLMVKGISAGITPYTGPPAVPSLVTNTGVTYSGANNTGSAGATSLALSGTGSTLNLTAGDYLVVIDAGVGNSAQTANKPSMSAPTVSAGTIGTCTKITNASIVGNSNYQWGTEIDVCGPITAGATGVTPTGHWAAACYYCSIWAGDVHNLNASTPDAGIGNTATQASGSTIAVSTNGGGTSGKQYFLITSNVSGGGTSSGPSGWGALVNSGSLGWGLSYEVAASGSVVTATSTLNSSSAGNATIWAGTP